MNGEKEIINKILSEFPACRGHLNRFFESDAEVLEVGEGKLLFTTDEFSSEDFFIESEPEILGWNLACCTLSDILASAGEPRYYAHALTLSSSWGPEYIEYFTRGIASALHLAGAGFIGGDLGSSENWKYTGICLGFAETPVTRRGALPGDRIYITGEIGAGNLMAALKLYSGEESGGLGVKPDQLKFPLRIREAAIIRRFATSCIDTSDGVLNGLNTLAEINQVGYRAVNLPYLAQGVQVCDLIGKPRTFLFAGECGEYELLFTIRPGREKEFIRQAEAGKLHFTYIGEVSEDSARILLENGKELKFNNFNISARGYNSIDQYLYDLTKYILNAEGS